MNEKSLLKSETPASHKMRSHEDWEPEWISYVFSCIFKCNNANCKQPVSCCGSGSVDQHEYEDEEFGLAQSMDDTFIPRYFDPALVLIDVPAKCPPKVSEHLAESFSLFFADPGASLNCARAAVEALLTDLGIKRFATANGKRRLVSLHQRIQSLPSKYHDLVDILLATKWLGNAGSHDGDEPSAGDVRVMYDLLEHILSDVYDSKGKKLKAIAKKVNKKKGPIK